MRASIRFFTLLLIATFSVSCTHNKGIAESAPLAIEVAKVESKLLPYTKEFIAPISANYSATIQPRIAGFLIRSSFRNGMPVKPNKESQVTCIFRRMCSSACFSSLLTCAWLMPISEATSICVRP